MMRKGSIRTGRVVKEYNIHYCEKRSELGDGCDFGDLALLNDKPRAAHVRAEEMCYLAVLDRNQYNEILKKHAKKKKDNEIDQLGNFLIFRGFSRVYKSKCLESMKTLNLVRGNSIYKENDIVYRLLDEWDPRKTVDRKKTSRELALSPRKQKYLMNKQSMQNEKILVPYDRLYFVVEGEFEICKSITTIKEENSTSIDFNGLKIDEEMKNELGEDYEKLCILESRHPYKNLHPQDSLTARKMRSTKRVQLCIVGPGEIIGAGEYIFKNTKRFSEVSCLSKKAKVLSMKIEDIDCLRKNEENMSKMKKLTIEKLKLIAEQLSSMEMMQENQYRIAKENQIKVNPRAQHVRDLMENENERAFAKRLSKQGIFRRTCAHVKRSSDLKSEFVSTTHFVTQLIKRSDPKTKDSLPTKISKIPIVHHLKTKSHLPSDPKPLVLLKSKNNSNKKLKIKSRITEEGRRSSLSTASMKKTRSGVSLGEFINGDILNLKCGHKADNSRKSQFGVRKQSDASSEFKTNYENKRGSGGEENHFDILPRVMALKAGKYRRIHKQPKSIDYNAILINDPSKNNKRFINTCKNSNKSSLGGGFRVKHKEDSMQFLPSELFSSRRTLSQQSMRINKIKTKNQKHRRSIL